MRPELTKIGRNAVTTVEASETIQDVKSIIASFFMAAKNNTMYPEHHVVYKESLRNVMSHLDAFFKKQSRLRLDVEKNRFLFEEEPVYKDDPKKGEWAHPLYRDGIQWLEFQAGLELGEISEFIKIINQYRKLQEEPNGDLVTALWEKDLPHLQYAAADILWKAETVKDFSDFNVTDRCTPAAGDLGVEGDVSQGGESFQEDIDDDIQDAADAGGGRGTEVDMGFSLMDRTIWEMTPEEFRRIEEMVIEEETQNSTEDVLDVLRLILITQDEKEDFEIILEFIKEEFKNTLAQGEFEIALDFLKSLKKECQSYKTEKSWVGPLLDQFFINIADGQVLDVLKEVLPSLDKQRIDRVTVFRKLLLSLGPRAITALGPMLLGNISVPLERQIMEIIGSLAIKNIHPLEKLLDRPEETLVKKLVFILGHINGEKPVQILIRMTGHPSARVRLEALKALNRRNTDMAKDLFPLINDPVLPIRRMVWDHLETYHNEDIGELILDYLEQKKMLYRDDQQILNCYRVLGRCGTLRSIPLLRQTLISQGWEFGSERSLRRQGAALALIELNTEESREVLNKASRSLFPNIRSAYQRALKDHQ
jgi:HEAT repeat protein